MKLKRLLAWFAPKQRDYTAETLERCTKACVECGSMLLVYQDYARKYRGFIELCATGYFSAANVEAVQRDAIELLSTESSGDSTP